MPAVDTAGRVLSWGILKTHYLEWKPGSCGKWVLQGPTLASQAPLLCNLTSRTGARGRTQDPGLTPPQADPGPPCQRQRGGYPGWIWAELGRQGLGGEGTHREAQGGPPRDGKGDGNGEWMVTSRRPDTALALLPSCACVLGGPLPSSYQAQGPLLPLHLSHPGSFQAL